MQGEEQTITIDDLPDELAQLVLSELDPRTYYRIGSTSSRFRNLTQDPLIEKSMVARNYYLQEVTDQNGLIHRFTANHQGVKHGVEQIHYRGTLLVHRNYYHGLLDDLSFETTARSDIDPATGNSTITVTNLSIGLYRRGVIVWVRGYDIELSGMTKYINTDDQLRLHGPYYNDNVYYTYNHGVRDGPAMMFKDGNRVLSIIDQFLPEEVPIISTMAPQMLDYRWVENLSPIYEARSHNPYQDAWITIYEHIYSITFNIGVVEYFNYTNDILSGDWSLMKDGVYVGMTYYEHNLPVGSVSTPGYSCAFAKQKRLGREDYSVDGRTITTHYRDNYLHGQQSQLTPDGRIHSVNYQYGLPHGTESYRDNIDALIWHTVQWINGKRRGVERIWNKERNTVLTIDWVNDLRSGMESYTENGKLVYEAEWNNGVLIRYRMTDEHWITSTSSKVDPRFVGTPPTYTSITHTFALTTITITVLNHTVSPPLFNLVPQ